MKKFLLIILSLIIAVLFAGCSFVTTPDDSANGKPDNNLPDNVEDEGTVFKVTLIYENAPFYPMETMRAQWTGEDGVYDAEFNVFGVAQITGLDGDYRVTLSNVPTGYTYDPNNHYADNYNTDITIEILKLNPWGPGSGTNTLSAIEVRQLGTYRASLTERNQWIYFKYRPLAAGVYSIQSWVDIVANEVNPILERYNANSGGWSEWIRRSDSGGSASSFTKNFRMDISISAAEIPSDEGQDGNIWLFAIHADVANEVLYPVIIDFTIKFEDDYFFKENNYELVEANGPFADGEWWANHPITGNTFRYVFEDTDKAMSTSHPLGEIMLNAADGFYHFYNKETGTFGDILYVKLTQPNLFIDAENGFVSVQVSSRFEGKDYSEFLITYTNFCREADGIHPVNAELQKFLQLYAIGQQLFDDGDGYAENLGYNSSEDNMWLFAVGYFC